MPVGEGGTKGDLEWALRTTEGSFQYPVISQKIDSPRP